MPMFCWAENDENIIICKRVASNRTNSVSTKKDNPGEPHGNTIHW